MKLLLIQLFWFSFALIGYALTHVICRLFPSSRYAAITKGINQLHVLTGFLHAFVIGFLAYAIFTTPAYIIGTPIPILCFIYVACLLFMIAGIIYGRARLKLRLGGTLPWWLIIVTFILIFDYVYALHTAPNLLTGDAWVHIAKVSQMSRGSITLSDPFFGYNGVVELRYSANLMHALMAVGARLLGVSAVTMWTASMGFFRLVMWLSLFTMTFSSLPMKIRRIWSYGVLCILPFLSPVFFSTALYPDRIALAWSAIALTGLLMLDTMKGKYLFIVGCTLVALTHTLNALMLASFVAFFTAVLCITRRPSRQELMTLLVGCFICLIPVAALAYYPNLSAHSETAVNAAQISGSKLEILHWKSLRVVTVHFGEVINAAIVLSAGALYWVIRKTKQRYAVHRIVILSGFLLAISLLLGYSPAVFGFIGLLWLIAVQKDLYKRLLLSCLTVFYAFIIYNPLILTPLMGRLPPWGIARFRELNVLALGAPLIAMFAMSDHLLQSVKVKNQVMPVVLAVGMMFVFVPFPHKLSLNTASPQRHDDSQTVAQQQTEIGRASCRERG